MNNELPSRYNDVEPTYELQQDQVVNQEIAMKAHFAQQFGHIAIRHANKEVSKADYDRFHDLYVDKLSKHSLVIDRTALARDFDIWVDTMLPAAQADIDDAMREQETDSLPEFTSPERMSEMTTSSDDKLLHENLRLVEENSRFMNQLVGMSKELRDVKSQLRQLRQEHDDLIIQAGRSRHEVLSEI